MYDYYKKNSSYRVYSNITFFVQLPHVKIIISPIRIKIERTKKWFIDHALHLQTVHMHAHGYTETSKRREGIREESNGRAGKIQITFK